MKKIIEYYLKNSKDLKLSIIIYFLIAIITSILSACFPLFEGSLIDSISQRKISRFIYIIVLYGSLSLISLILNLIMNKLSIKLSNKSLNCMMMYNLEHLLHIPYDKISKEDFSVITQEMVQDSETINNFVVKSTFTTIINIILLFFTVCIVMQKSIVMMFLILMSSMMYIGVYFVFKNQNYVFSKKIKESISLYYSYFYKLMNSIKDIKLNSLISYSKNMQNKFFDRQLSDYLSYQNLINTQELFSGLINFFTQLFIFIYGFKLVLENKLTVGSIIVISNYFSTILNYSKGILSFSAEYQNTKASYDRIIQWEKIPEVSNGNLILDDIYEIQCIKLTFFYGDNLIIDKEDIHLKKGKAYLIKGNNGSGKTTLLDCIFGIFGNRYDGNILFNKIDIHEIDMIKTIEKNFAISQQIPFLIDDSIKNNMCCRGNKSDNEMMYLIKGFGLDKYIGKLPNKENTLLNLYSDDLSGGEKQKISLIRTILSNKPVLVFDEPYTYLDERAKCFFDSEINKLRKKSIIIIVSHEDVGATIDSVINL